MIVAVHVNENLAQLPGAQADSLYHNDEEMGVSEPDLNHKVYIWAHSRMGQHVGRGECWDLADQALRAAGAASSTTTGKQDDYVWGDPVGLHQVVAGDILQLRNHLITVKKSTKVTFDDGTWYTQEDTERHERPHHTAIVAAYQAHAGILVFEQHVKPLGERVQLNTIAVADSTVVETTFRSMKDKKTGHMRPARVVDTKTTQVTGQIWAYRPKARK